MIEQYDACLSRYENHDEKDYREVVLESLLKTDPKNARIKRLRLNLFFDNVFEYWHYLVTWILMLVWAVALFDNVPK
jgi:hypothetical protein